MEKLLTTKDLAEAIGASESSLRRWTNSGLIRTSKTAGGHRRIPLSEAIRFIRESHIAIVRPGILGLQLSPGSQGQGLASPASNQLTLFEALTLGDIQRARGLLLSLYLEGTNCSTIFDTTMQPALERIGELWEHDARGILTEHRAIDICIQVVNYVRQLFPAPAESAPVAVGGAPAHDPYLLSSIMAATVLAEAGYRDANFGPNTPLDLLADAAQERKAELVWISVSVEQKPAAVRAVEALSARLAAQRTRLVIGGRYARSLLPKPVPNVTWLNTFSELAAFVRGANVPPGEPPAAAPQLP